MSLECYKGKGGSSLYYYEGKRISKAKAKLLGTKLPKCVSKTNQNVIDSLKRQLKEVLTHREDIKGINKELDAKLKGCSIVKEEYDNLLSLIKSSKSMVDVMDRVCLTQDLKKEMDIEYRSLKDNLEVKSKNYEKIKDLYESTINNVKLLSQRLREQKADSKKVEKTLSEEREVKKRVLSKLDKLTQECSDRPDLLKRVDELSNELITLNDTTETLKTNLLDTQDTVNQLTETVNNLDDELNTVRGLLETERRRVEEAYKVIETNKIDVQRYEAEIASLEDENKTLRQSVGNLEEDILSLQNEYSDLRDMWERLSEESKEMYQKNIELEEGKEYMIGRISQLDKSLGDAVNKYTDDIAEADEEIRRLQEENDVLKERLNEKDESCDKDKAKLNELIRQFTVRARELQQDLSKEKDECLYRVQSAIDSEKEMSSREAKEYKKELSDLNYKLLMTEEALEELKRAENLTGVQQEKKVKKAVKKMKKAEKPTWKP